MLTNNWQGVLNNVMNQTVPGNTCKTVEGVVIRVKKHLMSRKLDIFVKAVHRIIQHIILRCMKCIRPQSFLDPVKQKV